MPAKRTTMALVALALAAAVAAGASAQTKDVKLALPFPNGAAWLHLSVAEELGYFKEEGLKVSVLSLNDSAASFKAMATGQADFAFTGPAQVLNGLAAGEATVSIYNSYQGHVFQFAAPADSRYKMIAEVGRGGADAVALREKRIAAYSASFVDMMAIELRGTKLHRFQEGPTASFISDCQVASKATLDKDRKTAVGLSRAIAKATHFCMENAEACWAIITMHVPDNGKNLDFTKPLLRYTLELHKVGPEGQGKWGYQSPKSWAAIHDFQIDSDQPKQKVKVVAGFTNELIADINTFDAAKVAAAAKGYK